MGGAADPSPYAIAQARFCRKKLRWLPEEEGLLAQSALRGRPLMSATPSQGSRSVLSADRYPVESGEKLSPKARGALWKGELNPHPPPHLREICVILAAGLVRLHCRTAEKLAADAAKAAAEGESSLHFTGRQSVHADPLKRASA